MADQPTEPKGSSQAQPTKSVNFEEIGASGLRHTAGMVLEEFVPNLQGRRANMVFREMSDNEPIVGGITLAFEQVAGRLDWHIEPPENASADEEKATEFIQSAWADMQDSWDTTLSNVLSMLTFGWSYFEVNYKKRNGYKDDDRLSSRYDDGKIGWSNWAIRAQESLMKWELGDNGSIDGLTQMDPHTGRVLTVPMEKALLFRTNEFKNNPQGRSMLRNAYVPYYYLKRIREYEAIGIERDLSGMPVVRMPAEWFESSATEAQKQAVQAMARMVSEIRDNKRKGLVIPTAYDEHGNRLIDFELLASPSTRAQNTNEIITRYKQEIAISLLSDYLMLGHERIGTYNLGTAKIDQWVMVVDSLCKSVADVVNKHAIEKLLRINGFNYVNPPTLSYGAVQNVDLQQLASYVTALNTAGLLTYDPTLEAWLREMGGMPVAEEEYAGLHAEQEKQKLEMPIPDPMALAQAKGEAAAASLNGGKPGDKAPSNAPADSKGSNPSTPKPQDAAAGKDQEASK